MVRDIIPLSIAGPPEASPVPKPPLAVSGPKIIKDLLISRC